MPFWDGTHWIPESGRQPTNGRARTPTGRLERLRDLAATGLMVLGLVALIIPFMAASATGPSVAVSPGSGSTGQKVQVTGSGFVTRVKLQVTWDGSASGMPTAQVNASGTFKTSFVVPKGKAGSHTVAVAEVTSNGGGKVKALTAAVAAVTFTLTALAASPTPTAATNPTPAPTATPSPTPTATPKPTPTPTLDPTAAPTASATPTPAPSATATPAATDPAWGLAGGYGGISLYDVYQHGIRVVLAEMNWASAEPAEGTFSSSYFSSKRSEIAAYRAAGFGVVLNFGMHHAPGWLLAKPNARYVDQFGTTYTGSDEANLVWATNLRSYAERYTREVFAQLGTDFVAVRVGGGHWGELTYPDRIYGGTTNAYWAFDGAAALTDPVPGWKPGDPSPSAEAARFINWYLDALTSFQNWQIATVRSVFSGTIAVLYPSWGLRAGDLDKAVATNLAGTSSPEVNGEVQRGYDHARHIAAVSDREVAVWGTWADKSGTISWLASLASAHGLRMMGENSGGDDLTGLSTALTAARSYHLDVFLWIRASEAYCSCNGYATIADYATGISSASG